jgi:hypothetical protein
MKDTASWITFGKDRYHQHTEMQNWCTSKFGPGNWISERTVKDWEGMQVNWTIHSMFGNTTFCFKDPKDLMHFIFRWS